MHHFQLLPEGVGKQGGCASRRARIDETFELSPAQEHELLVALAQADRGEGMDGDEFLESLPQAADSTDSRRGDVG